MLMAVEVAVSFPFEGRENVDSHVGEPGAVAVSCDMMLEAERRISTATERTYLITLNLVSNEILRSQSLDFY